MKNLLMVLVVIVALLQSCSRDSQNIVPAAKTSLGLVVPNETQPSTNLILLKDGRTVKPVSGIPNFKAMRAGSKLSLSFVTGSSHGGVVDIDVKNYATAKDSVFTVGSSNPDTTRLAGLFRGTFTTRRSTNDAA